MTHRTHMYDTVPANARFPIDFEGAAYFPYTATPRFGRNRLGVSQDCVAPVGTFRIPLEVRTFHVPLRFTGMYKP